MAGYFEVVLFLDIGCGSCPESLLSHMLLFMHFFSMHFIFNSNHNKKDIKQSEDLKLHFLLKLFIFFRE